MITRKIKIENFFIIFPVLIRTLRTIHNHFLKVTLLRGGLGVLAFQPLQKWCYWRPGFLEFILLLILFKSTTKHSYFTKLKKWWRSPVNSAWIFACWNLGVSHSCLGRQADDMKSARSSASACRRVWGVLELKVDLVMTGDGKFLSLVTLRACRESTARFPTAAAVQKRSNLLGTLCYQVWTVSWMVNDW